MLGPTRYEAGDRTCKKENVGAVRVNERREYEHSACLARRVLGKEEARRVTELRVSRLRELGSLRTASMIWVEEQGVGL